MADFERLISFKVNNGERVCFWKDPWCSDVPLCILYPPLLSLVQNKKGMVKEYIIRTRIFCSWDLLFCRNLNDWEVEEAGR